MLNDFAEINVLDYGAKGDGLADDQPAIQRALNGGNKRIRIPEGTYRLGGQLTVDSDTEINADQNAVLILADGVMKGPKDFMISNRNWETGDRNISVRGGIWDYNNPGNVRGEMFDPNSITGTMMHFHTVTGLVLENLTLRDPECYYITTLDVRGFRIENILFDSPHLRPNQDGIHLGAGCEDGLIRGLRGTKGSPYDDVIAFSADNCMTRLQNLNLHCGDIRNIIAEDIDCPECHTIVRIASIDSTVENVVLRNIRAGATHFFLNLDATHKSRTPVVFPDEERYYTGVGHVKNLYVADCRIWSTDGTDPMIDVEENVENMVLRNITVDEKHVSGPDAPVFRLRLCGPTQAEFRGLDKSSIDSIHSERCDIRSEKEAAGKDAVSYRLTVKKHLYGVFEMEGDIPFAELNPVEN